MSVAYKGPDGRLYRASERPDAKGEYYIEYRDPAASAVYKPLPGYHHNANRDAVVSQLAGLIKELGLQAVMLEEHATNPAPTPEKPKGSGVWLYGDHRAMRVGIGNDTDRSDCRYYHVLVLNLLADKPCWRKLSGAGNYDYKHLADADAELRETLPEDAHELTATEAKQLFTSPSTGFFELKPHAVKAWDEIMAGPSSTAKPASDVEPIPAWAIPIAQDFVRNDWVRKLAEFSPACLRASSEARAHAGGTCGPGFADASPQGIKLWDGHKREVEYTWAKFVRVCKAAGIQPAAPEPASSPASAEPLEVVDECSEQDTVPAALAAPPAADIAVPAFDFGADEPTNTALLQCVQAFVAGRLAQVMAAKRAHDLTADHYQGSWGKWCTAIGISRDTGDNFVRVAENFGNVELNGRPLVEVTPISLLALASKPSAPLELKQGVENGDITTTKQYRELETQLKAEREGRETAEREKREALAWKQHAEGQAEDAKAAIHAAQQTAQEAQRKVRQAEAKVEHQESMLAELQDRLDEANAQLRNPPLEAKMVDKDEVERRAQELAAQKIAEALSVQKRQPLCDLVAVLNDTIKNAWELSGIEGRKPESEDDESSLEMLYDTAYRITEWADGWLSFEGQEEAAEDE